MIIHGSAMYLVVTVFPDAVPVMYMAREEDGYGINVQLP
jgi:hypothetical protein